MPDITIGCVVREHSKNDEPKPYGRVVHIDKQQNLVFLVKFPRKNSMGHPRYYVPSPVISDLSAWRERIEQGQCSAIDFDPPPHWLLTSEELRSNAATGLLSSSRRNLEHWLKRRDAAYELIRPFVEGRSIEEIVFDPALKGWPSRRAKELNKKGCTRIQRVLNAYILALGNRNGLLPSYSHCGNPGKQKHSKRKTGRPTEPGQTNPKAKGLNCDKHARDAFILGWQKFKKKGVSVRTAFNKTLKSFFAKSVCVDGTSAKVNLHPNALQYTVKQFEYWGRRGPDALTAGQINKGETAAKRAYMRRQGKVRDRHLTVNGEAFLDSTSCDQTLVSCASRLKILSSPWRTDVQGAATDYIFGHHVGFESPSQTTALMAIFHAAEDKVEYCARFGIKIEPRDWLPMTFRRFVMDNGEGKGELAMKTLEDMECGASFGAAYDAINKSPQESKHASTQAHVDHLMPGSTMGRKAERGEENRARLARLNFFEYMPILIRHVLFHNNKEIITLPTLEMRRDGVEPTRRGVVEWMIDKGYTTSAPIDLQTLRITCLPRIQACIQPSGIHLYDPVYSNKRIIHGLVYSSDWLRKSGLLASTRRRYLEVHVNPSDLSQVWANLGGLKCFSMQSSDPDMKEVTLLDWLSICGDDRTRAYINRAQKHQEGVNAIESVNRATAAATKERNAEIKKRGAKPSTSELKRGKRENSALEKSAITGVPRAPKVSRLEHTADAPPQDKHSLVKKPGAQVDLAQAIRKSRNK